MSIKRWSFDILCGFLPGNQQGWPCFSSLPGRSEQAMWSSGAKLKQRDFKIYHDLLAPMFNWSDGSELQSLQPHDGRSATIVIAYLMWRCATRCIMMNHFESSATVPRTSSMLQRVSGSWSAGLAYLLKPLMSGYGRSVPFAIQTQADAGECLSLGCPTLLKVMWLDRACCCIHALGATIATISNSVALNLQAASQSVWMESSEMAGFTCQLLQLAKKLSSSQARHLSFARHLTILQPLKFPSPVPWVHPS